MNANATPAHPPLPGTVTERPEGHPTAATHPDSTPTTTLSPSSAPGAPAHPPPSMLASGCLPEEHSITTPIVPPATLGPAPSANTTQPTNREQLLTNLFLLGVVVVGLAFLALTGIHCPFDPPTQPIPLLMCTTSSLGGWVVTIVGGMCMGHRALNTQHLIICSISVLSGVWLSDLPLRLVFLSLSIPLWEGPGSSFIPILGMVLAHLVWVGWWSISLWNLYTEMTRTTLHPPQAFEWFCNALYSIRAFNTPTNAEPEDLSTQGAPQPGMFTWLSDLTHKKYQPVKDELDTDGVFFSLA
ncbi:hypothetical protein PAXRUDRAFT_824015 [Paxillus rubicundulus Ve08.2h10]|uniref:Unplaced genomic scaffold scaffold_76, whole genome shotgun sequence n=1 Tax=Paxillus rubicundulus Ve08.2h10 TaxID=930991 RepID=A0A0D0E2P6_9AGAM|nr:hypothetical protein PAXRUDRAFT_824015 [Paxillus rubicundulus Ve08.2h10]